MTLSESVMLHHVVHIMSRAKKLTSCNQVYPNTSLQLTATDYFWIS